MATVRRNAMKPAGSLLKLEFYFLVLIDFILVDVAFLNEAIAASMNET